LTTRDVVSSATGPDDLAVSACPNIRAVLWISDFRMSARDQTGNPSGGSDAPNPRGHPDFIGPVRIVTPRQCGASANDAAYSERIHQFALLSRADLALKPRVGPSKGRAA